jgi:hypothetical protein
MQRSSEAILTTHTGSLPRPDDLVDLLFASYQVGVAPQPLAHQLWMFDVVGTRILSSPSSPQWWKGQPSPHASSGA